MLKSIFNIIKSIGNAITSVFNFVVGFFKDIAEIVGLVGDAIVNATQLIDTVIPIELVGILLVLLGVTVVYRIWGRD